MFYGTAEEGACMEGGVHLPNVRVHVSGCLHAVSVTMAE